MEGAYSSGGSRITRWGCFVIEGGMLGEMSSAERQDTAESAQRPCLRPALNLIGCRTLKSCNLAAAFRSEYESRPNPNSFTTVFILIFDVSLCPTSLIHHAVLQLGAFGSKQLAGSCSRPQHPTESAWKGMFPRDAAQG